MRSLAGLAITFGVMTTGAATAAAAQSAPAVLDQAASRLMDAAFAPDPDQLFEQSVDITGRWRTDSLARVAADGSAVDTLRISTGEGGGPFDLTSLGAGGYEVRLTRDWPSAVRYEGERYDIALTPHAGFGVSSIGHSAEAGATLTLGQREDAIAARLVSLGVRDGAVFGGAGRWYVFAAASGRAMGFNMLKNGAAGLDRSWSQDSSSTLVGDAQLGVGWRKGSMQTSFGYIHREVKGAHMLWGQEAKDDSMVAFSLSIKPRR
ncbi:MAG TPA: lipid A-modifier LpxR family protein [Phenylobacterium sp.]|nr:lipid A-modifier LpxR family protein [Phenylobacterium sp.]